MKLTIKDRVLILNAVLPQFDTRINTQLKISIVGKLNLVKEEQLDVTIIPQKNGQYDIGFKSILATTHECSFEISDMELIYLKSRVLYIDKTGMFSTETIPTYDKILNEPFSTEEYQTKWNELTGVIQES